VKHSKHQRNDAVDPEGDCRRKYIARHLPRKLAKDQRLTSFSNHDDGAFKLWCDDLRPVDVLLNAGWQFVGVVDWEFTYAAPAESSSTPPWWLLFDRPNYWSEGMQGWTVY
jgi:hypothetical protein